MIALGDAGVAVLDCVHATPVDAGVGFPYIAIPNIQNGRISLAGVRRISRRDFDRWTAKTTPQTGDIVVTRRGRVGDTAPIPQDLDCAIGQNLVLLRSDGSAVDQSFLRWATTGPVWNSEVDRLRNVGAVFDSLNVRDISRLQIRLPPLDEQRRIAEVLGALDDLIDTNNRMRERLVQLARHLMIRAGRRTESETPLAKCVHKTVGGVWGEDHAFLESEQALAIRGIDLANLAQFAGATPPLRHLTPAQVVSRLLEGGELIIEASGTNCGRAWVPLDIQLDSFEFPVVFSNFCKRFVIDQETVGPRFVHHFLANEFDAGRIQEFRIGSAMPNLDVSALLEQTAIPVGPAIFEVEESLEQIDRAATDLELENQQLRRTRDELLPLLMSGKVRVRPEGVSA